MSLLQHVEQLVLSFLILVGPIPLCFALIAVCHVGQVGNLSAVGQLGNLSSKPGQPRFRFPECAFLVLAGWSLLQTSLSLFLGMIHCLSLAPVILAECLLFVLGTVLVVRLKRPAPGFSFRELVRIAQPFGSLEKLIVLVMACVGADLLWTLLAEPITEFDSLSYHLPTMAGWYQHHSFVMLEQFYYPEIISTYPYNWEALCTLFLRPFHEDFLVALPNSVAWALFGVATCSLGIEMGATRIKSMAAAALVLTLPMVAHLVNTMHVDLPFAAVFMGGLYLMALFVRTRSLSYLALFFAMLGMLVGTRTTGLAYGFLLLVILVLLEIRAARLRRVSGAQAIVAFRGAIPLAAMAIVCFLFLGGSWYGKNLSATGNPFGYMRVKIAGLVLFPGPYGFSVFQPTTLFHLFQLANPSHWKIFLGQVWAQLQIPFLAMLLQVLVLPIGLVVSGRQIRDVRLLGLAALLLITGFMYWMTPLSADNGSHGLQITPWLGGQMRFALPFIGLLAVTAAIVATKMRTHDLLVAAVVVAGGALLLSRSYAIYVATFLVFVWGVLTIIGGKRFTARTTAFWWRMERELLVAAIVTVLVAVTFIARQKRDACRNVVYGPVVEFIQKNVKRDETIGYLLSKRAYLFYGRHLDRKVVYVPARSDNLSEWVKQLHADGVRVVAVGPLWGQANPARELKWLEDPTGPFVCVFQENPDTDPMLFRFKSE